MVCTPHRRGKPAALQRLLIGVFELLADARAQIVSVNNYIDSLRDSWIAGADIDMAMIGRPSLAAPAGPAIAAEPGSAEH